FAFGKAPTNGGCGHGSFPLVAEWEVDIILRKEVIQPQVPLRLPCYDLVPIDRFIFGVCEDDFGCPDLSWLDGRCVQGSGTHSPRYSDPRLLAIPASCRRVAACNPNWGAIFAICWLSRVCIALYVPL